MAEHEVATTDAEIEEALERANLRKKEPLAQRVEHVTDLNLLIVSLSNGRRLLLPVEDLQGLESATHKQMQNYELLGRGTGISFPELDVDLYVPALIEGVYGNRRWMAQLGKKGGAARTEAKRLAAKVNGAKGGRPKKTTPQVEAASLGERYRFDQIPVVHDPGVYAFYLREFAALPNVSTDTTGLLYIGMTKSSLNARNHFSHRDASFSTFRRSLGALLKDHLDLHARCRGKDISDKSSTHYHFGADGEERLTKWMQENLEYSFELVTEDIEGRESHLIKQLHPPLNLTQWSNEQQRKSLMELRRVCREEAANSELAPVGLVG
jgi:Protein of unknown function (DUF2442)